MISTAMTMIARLLLFLSLFPEMRCDAEDGEGAICDMDVSESICMIGQEPENYEECHMKIYAQN